ncbi:MAG: DUF3623 family protein [Gemmatimonadaceae bacterium]
MSDSTLSRSAASAATSLPKASLGASLALVIGFWWAATGLTLAMQRSSLTSVASVAIASVFALVGAVLIVKTRTDTTVRSARLAFLGSALVWWWCSTLFYAGIGINIADSAAVVPPPRTFAFALQAIAATLRPDLVGVFALVLIGILVWRRPNRFALGALFTFWGTLQTAKLNVFMGVRNSGVDWLPEHLVKLSQFFGPPQNSLLLPVTIAGLGICFASMARSSSAADQPFAKHGYAMIAFLLALAVLEHIMLGVNLSLPLWDIFRPQN